MKAVIELGIGFAPNSAVRRKIKNINIAALLAIIGYLIYTVLYLLTDFSGLQVPILINCVSILLFTMTLLMNRRGLFLISGIALMLSLTVGLAAIMLFYFGTAANLHYHILLVAFAAITVLGFHQLRVMLTIILINCIIFVLVHSAAIHPIWHMPSALDEFTINLYSFLSVSTVFTVALILVLVAEHSAFANEQRLEELVTRDALTGLHNRRHLSKKALAECIRSDRRNLPMSLLLIDVDHFKNINDQYGHPVGDQVLAILGQRINDSFRPYDIRARMGGEEFGILMLDTLLKDAQRLAQQLLEAINNNQPEIDGNKIPLTVSIGVAEYRNSEGFDRLYSRADRALYSAKTNGRNRVEITC